MRDPAGADYTVVKCRRCGRALKTLEAMNAGIGSVCQRQEQYELTREIPAEMPVPKRERQSKAAKLVRFAFDIGVRK
jgi:hypothetical protein